MAETALTAEPRQETGKGPSGRLRREGKVPAVLYGLGQDSVPLTVDERTFGDLLRRAGRNVVINLEVGAITQPVVVQEIQRHPISLRTQTVDFLRIDITKPIQADVPITLVGAPIDMDPQDVIQQIMRTATIETLPIDVPDEIQVDISTLSLAEPITCAKLPVPEGATLIHEPEEPVVTLVRPSLEPVEEEEPEEGELAEGEELPEGAEAPEGEAAEADGAD